MNELFSTAVDVIVEEFRPRPQNSKMKLSPAGKFFFMAEHIHSGNAAVRALIKVGDEDVPVHGQRSGMLSKANAFQLWVRKGTRTFAALLLAFMKSPDLEGYAGTNYKLKFHCEYGGCPLAGFGTPHADEFDDRQKWRFTWPFPGKIRSRAGVRYEGALLPEEDGFRDRALRLAGEVAVGLMVFTKGAPMAYHTSAVAVGVATAAFFALGMSSKIRCYDQERARGDESRRLSHSRVLVDKNTLQLLFELADAALQGGGDLRKILGRIFVDFLVYFYLYVYRKKNRGVPPAFTEECDPSDMPQLRDAIEKEKKEKPKTIIIVW